MLVQFQWYHFLAAVVTNSQDYNMQGFIVAAQIIMQAEQQKLPISFSTIKEHLSIPIVKVIATPHFRHHYYHAITPFGTMCLVVEKVPIHLMPWIDERNQLMAKHFKCFPLIFEQRVIETSEREAICLTLMEDCSDLGSTVLGQSLEVKLNNFPKLITSIQLIQENNIALQNEELVANLIYLNNSEEISLDFTALVPPHSSKFHSQHQNLLNFIIKCLSRRFNSSNRICEVIFIKGQIFTFQPEKLIEAGDYTEMLMFINMYPDQEIDLVSRSANSVSKDNSPTKTKKVKIKQLEGNPLLAIKHKQYSLFQFLDGKCVNCLREIFYEELSTKFIHESSLYKLQQFEHLVVHAFPNNSKTEEEETILVYPPVSKVELISFLIAYVKCVNPVLNSIEYLALENTLKLRFWNRRREEKVLRMVFYQEYLVKDEELSMILEKSNLSHSKLSLRDMKITDSFLIFLSHSEKTNDITQLHLTGNCSLSEVGLTTFLKSPNSSNLNSFSLTVNNDDSSILEESIEEIGRKQSLKKLSLHKLASHQAKINQIDVSKLNLVQLQCFGVCVTLFHKLKQTLKILRLDQKVNVEELTNIRHLKLVELKICLVETHKKSLMDSISGLSSLTSSLKFNKMDEVQQFATGQSRKTLKIIDLSNSHCKFRTFRSILQMGQLEQIKLDNCSNIGSQFDPILPKVLQASFVGMEANLQNFMVILRNSRQLIELNIINTRISKQDIVKLMDKLNLHVSNLIVSEKQFSNKLLETEGPYGLIECIQLCIDRMLEQEQEYSFNLLISKASSCSKTVRFIFSPTDAVDQAEMQAKKQLFMSRINKYLIMSSASLESLDNLYVNKTKITELLQIQEDFSVEDFCESHVASSIQISADKCKIVSEPKIIMQKNGDQSVIFKALKKQTIDKLTHRFVKFMKENQLPVCIDLSNNKLIGKEIIDLCLSYSTALVRSVDFRGCMFDLDEVIDSIFLFTGITQINQGECSVRMARQNFSQRSQNYLKLFMHLKSLKKLSINCEEIEQGEILYSVLTHTVDRCSSTLQSLSLTLTRMTLNSKISNFMETILELSKLISFECVIQDCEVVEHSLQIWQKKLTNLKRVENIKLSMPSLHFPAVTLPSLTRVSLEFTGGEMEQEMANKCLRNLHLSKGIRELGISFANNSHISNVSRVFGTLPMGNVFEKLPCLELLSLNFEYCSLKEQTLFGLMSSLTQCPSLKTLELNVSFAIQNFTEFLNCVEHCFEQFSKPISLKIICVTPSSNAYLLQIENLTQKGVEFIV